MPTPEQTKQIKKRIAKSYVRGFLGAIALYLLALVSAHLINHYYPPRHIWAELFQYFSVVVLATALYGKKAIPEIWTTGASSEEEKFNDRLFNILSSLGFFSTILAYKLTAS